MFETNSTCILSESNVKPLNNFTSSTFSKKYPGFNCKGKSTKKGNHVSKITTDKIGIESEVNAGKRIKEKLANYKEFFLIVDKKSSLFRIWRCALFGRCRIYFYSDHSL